MSMFPALRAGWPVVFDPEREVSGGEYVHVVLKDGRCMIKELISEQHGMINLLSVIGDSRAAFSADEIVSINAFIDMKPPSAILAELPREADA